MNSHTKAVVEDCTHGSDAERMAFPDVVARLMQAGVERYRADLRRAEKIYYMPDGASHAVPTEAIPVPIADAFSPEGVREAVRAIQAGAIGYKAFCARIMAAGCVDYLVSLAGRRAVYFGRTGESYVELFPGAK